MVRLFTAVRVPERFVPVIAELEAQLPSNGLKLVKPEIAHITLRFIGEVVEERVPQIVDALRSVRMHKFDALLKGMGAFPSPRRARVVWMGCEGEFVPLFKSVEDALCSTGMDREKKQYHPHITLARVKRLTEEDGTRLEEVIRRHKSTQFGGFEVNEFVLFESILRKEGPTYREIEAFTLEE